MGVVRHGRNAGYGSCSPCCSPIGRQKHSECMKRDNKGSQKVENPRPGRSQHHQPKRGQVPCQRPFHKGSSQSWRWENRRAHLLSHSRSCRPVSSASPLPSMPYNVRLVTQRKVSAKSSPNLLRQRDGEKAVDDQQTWTISNTDMDNISDDD